jgi:hypothetical protein
MTLFAVDSRRRLFLRRAFSIFPRLITASKIPSAQTDRRTRSRQTPLMLAKEIALSPAEIKKAAKKIGLTEMTRAISKFSPAGSAGKIESGKISTVEKPKLNRREAVEFKKAAKKKKKQKKPKQKPEKRMPETKKSGKKSGAD